MKIQVLGSGCTNCKKLFEITKQAVKDLNIPGEVEYVTDVQEIVKMGLMSSPVLAVDGKPVLVGFVPNADTIKKAIQKALE
jgi:small redox-active disulfide protein 2